MQGPDVSFWIQQLAYRVPALLIYLIAFVLAIVYWNRARTASLLTMLGTVISVVTSIGFIILQSVLMHSEMDGGSGVADRAQMMSALGMTSSCAHSIGLALFVAAIFVGRNQYPREPE